MLNINKTRGQDFTQPISLSISEIKIKDLSIKSYWNTFTDNTHYEIRYEGFYKFANDKLRSLASRYYNRTYTKQLEDGNYNSYFDFLDRLKKDQIKINKREDPIWDRNFWEFFPIEKGGTEFKTRIIGSEYVIIDLGLISLNNAGKLRLDSFDLSFNQNEGLNLQKLLPANELNEQITQVSQNLEFAFTTPETSLKTNNLEIKLNFGANIRTTMSKENPSSLKVVLRIQFLNKDKKPWAEIAAKIQTQPINNQHSVQLFFQVLSF